jgi:hypothetical protein
MLRFATLMGGVPGFANLTGPVYEAVAYERLATLCVYPRRVWPSASGRRR